jgi:DNA repair ATPase RecN
MTSIIANIPHLFGIVLVILLVIAILVRLNLYGNINSLIQNIEKANRNVMKEISDIFGSESKYRNTLFNNKLAILDIYYSKQKIWGMNYDNLTYFTRSFPNLLISLGLFGTFVGITINLGDITDVIGNEGGEVSIVIGSLEQPLQSMAIAFYSSLYAIGCAILLTFVNNIWNVELKKEQLLNLLESRLDNLTTPDRDLDFRIKNIISTVLYGNDNHSGDLNTSIYQALSSVLYSHPEENTEFSLESLFNKVMKEYFPDFVESINGFVKSVDNFNDKVNVISDSSSKFIESAIIFEKSSKQIEGYSQALYEWRNKFADTQTEFLATTQHFSRKVDQLLEQNQEASNLAKQVYETFGQSTRDFELSTRRYQDVSEKIEQSQFPIKLAEASQNLEEFSIAAKTLQTNIKGMENMAKTMQGAIRVLHAVGQETKKLNQNSYEIITLNQERITQEEQQLNKIEQQISSSSQAMELVAGEVESYTQNVKQINNNLVSLSTEIAQINSDAHSQLEAVSNMTDAVNSLQIKTNELIVSHQTQQVEEVQQLTILTENHRVLVDKLIAHQNSIDLDEITLNLVAGINQKIQSNIRSLAKIILNLSNENNRHLQEAIVTLNSIKIQQQETNVIDVINQSSQKIMATIEAESNNNTGHLSEIVIGGLTKNRKSIEEINSLVSQNNVQLQQVNQTLNQLLVIAKNLQP